MFALKQFDLDGQEPIQFSDGINHGYEWALDHVESIILTWKKEINDNSQIKSEDPYTKCIRDIVNYYRTMTFLSSNMKGSFKNEIEYDILKCLAINGILLDVLMTPCTGKRSGMPFKSEPFTIPHKNLRRLGCARICTHFIFSEFDKIFDDCEDKDNFYTQYIINIMFDSLHMPNINFVISKEYVTIRYILDFIERHPKFGHLIGQTCRDADGKHISPYLYHLSFGRSPESELSKRLLQVFGDH